MIFGLNAKKNLNAVFKILHKIKECRLKPIQVD